jgi:hypothetical protein
MTFGFEDLWTSHYNSHSRHLELRSKQNKDQLCRNKDRLGRFIKGHLRSSSNGEEEKNDSYLSKIYRWIDEK